MAGLNFALDWAMKLWTVAVSVFFFVQTNALADFCGEPQKAICEQPGGLSNDHLIAYRIADLAASETQRFLAEKEVDSETFVNSILDTLKKTHFTEPKKVNQQFIRALTYLSCLDYLSRAYYSNPRDLSFVNASCFATSSVRPSIKVIGAEIRRLANSASQPKVMNTLRIAKKIVAEVIDKSSYSPIYKSRVKAQVENVEYLDFSNYLIEAYTQVLGVYHSDLGTALHFPAIAIDIIRTCSLLNNYPNAFNQAISTSDGAKNQMVICPAFWARSAKLKERRIFDIQPERRTVIDKLAVKRPKIFVPFVEGDMSFLMPVLFHELGHTIDIELRSAYYESMTEKAVNKSTVAAAFDFFEFAKCIKTTHVNWFGLVAKRKVEKKDQEPQIVTLDNDTTAQMFFNEYHADSVAANALSIYLRKFATYEERQRALGKGLSIFCEKGRGHEVSEGNNFTLHPSDSFRVRRTFLGNANLSKVVGCKTKVRPACSFM